MNVTRVHERAEQILAAYGSVIADRDDPASVDMIEEILPVIMAKVPDAGRDEIIEALMMGSRRWARKADALVGYARAKGILQ